MFVKVTTSGPRRYVKLVDSYRDEARKPRQRVIATLGHEAVTTSLNNAPLRANWPAGTCCITLVVPILTTRFQVNHQVTLVSVELGFAIPLGWLGQPEADVKHILIYS